jgi:hypothetical protein
MPVLMHVSVLVCGHLVLMPEQFIQSCHDMAGCHAGVFCQSNTFSSHFSDKHDVFSCGLALID